MMCSIIMPQMVQRKRGLIINIGSITGVTASANMTIYAATKAFVEKFSEDLSAEYKKDGIIVQSIRPGPVLTKMQFVDEILLITPSAKTYVESALRTIGFATQSSGYVIHAILQSYGQLLNFISPWLAQTSTMKIMQVIRDKRIKQGLYKSDLS